MMCRREHITHYENLANLDKVVNTRFTFAGFPLKVIGAHGLEPGRGPGRMTSVEPADHQASAPVVTVLGAGTMGAGMVRSLRRAGLPVRVWNRDGAKARALTDVGAVAFDSPAAAADGADVVITMLHDADAVTDAIRRAAPAPGTVWLQTSTVGLDGAERTIALARELGVEFVDSPVMGTRKPAEEGALVFLASGSESARPGSRRCSTRWGARRCGWARPGPGAG